jgi:hypothetical protein
MVSPKRKHLLCVRSGPWMGLTLDNRHVLEALLITVPWTILRAICSFGPALAINSFWGHGPIIAVILLVAFLFHDIFYSVADSTWNLHTRLREPGATMMSFHTHKTVSDVEDKAHSRRMSTYGYIGGAVLGCFVGVCFGFKATWGIAAATTAPVYIGEYANWLLQGGTHLSLTSARRAGEGSGWGDD